MTVVKCEGQVNIARKKISSYIYNEKELFSYNEEK